MPVGDRGDDVELRLEQPSQLLGDPRMVLGQQHPRSIHAPTVGGVAQPGRNSENHGGGSGELLRTGAWRALPRAGGCG